MILAAVGISLIAKGFLTDASHPKHPGDFQKYDATVTIMLLPESGLGTIDIQTGEGDKKDHDVYYVRGGRTYQLDDKLAEVPAKSVGDLSVAAIAALHPSLVESALRERKEQTKDLPNGTRLLAWNDTLWTVQTTEDGKSIAGLARDDFHELFGDSIERIDYARSPDRVSVSLRGREVANFVFGSSTKLLDLRLPPGAERTDFGHVIRSQEISFKEIAPHLFTVDLETTNSRIFVAEFADHVVVLEGAYNSRNGDALASAVRLRFGKRVRYHAFSHLHGQYVGSTRSWIAETATILVPPTTAPLIEQLGRADFHSHPDELFQVSHDRPVKTETVERSRKLEDGTNAMEIFNVPSEHTDEYFVFWFPAQKVLLTGDLLFYRPGKPLTGRSKRLCQTVAELGIAPERLVATWPLEGYETKNIVTGEEFKAACAPTP